MSQLLTLVDCMKKYMKGTGSSEGHKGTGTQDLIWLKVASLDRSWLVGLLNNL